MADAKVALVTGATSGIGRATALGFARSGYRVAACGRRQELLDTLAAETSGCEMHCAACDIRDADAVTALFDETVRRFGRIDVVFNNAGRGAPATNIGDFDLDVWREVVNVNLNGAFYVAREAFRRMRAQSPQGGRIINNGSISAHAPRPHAVAYNATKSAISGLTKSISLDGRPYSIACGQIDFGNATTDMTTEMAAGMLQADGTMQSEPTFDVQHAVDAVLYMAGLPLDANVQALTVMATNMPYVGRG